MSEFGALLQTLGDASGWAIAVAILFTFAWGFHKGWWVPGFVYQREVERADANDATVEAATVTIAASKDAAVVSAKAQSDLAKEVRGLQRRLEARATRESH